MSDENYVTIRPEHTNTHKEAFAENGQFRGKKTYLWAYAMEVKGHDH